jgi:hypothetical protein
MAAVDINVFRKPLTIGRGIPKHFRGFLEDLQMCGKQVVFEHLAGLPMGKEIEPAFLALESAKSLSADL